MPANPNKETRNLIYTGCGECLELEALDNSEEENNRHNKGDAASAVGGLVVRYSDIFPAIETEEGTVIYTGSGNAIIF